VRILRFLTVILAFMKPREALSAGFRGNWTVFSTQVLVQEHFDGRVNAKIASAATISGGGSLNGAFWQVSMYAVPMFLTTEGPA
jgi:hypothetical protein